MAPNDAESAKPLILASGSPRRADILRMLGIGFEVIPADVPEVLDVGESPAEYVERLAELKASVVQSRHNARWVLAGDTVVALGTEILEKPDSPSHAQEMLLAMAGRRHTVYSGLALASPAGVVLSRVDQADVWFRPFDAATARAYADTGEPLDKAGAYGIQGLGASLVERVSGDFFTIVGMSVAGLNALLEQSGLGYTFPPGVGRAGTAEGDRNAAG